MSSSHKLYATNKKRELAAAFYMVHTYRNVPLTENQDNIAYFCLWLLFILGRLLQVTTLRGYHAFLPQVVCQKRKPQIATNVLHI